MLYANVFPKQIKPIDFGWKNKTTSAGTFAVDPPGEIKMPHLVDYFDFSIFNVEEYQYPNMPFGTRNFKAPFTMAARFLGYEKLLVEMSDLWPITEELINWNVKLLHSYPFIEFFHIGDDFAGNQALLMSPKVWRHRLWTAYLKLVSVAKAYNKQVIFHSDGDIYEVLEDLIALDIDYLDYQPIGKMAQFADRESFKGIKLIINSIEEQEHKHDASMAMQKGEIHG
jgi:hypothetical protein